MSGRVVPMERDAHAQVLALLPWYARAQLAADEMGRVREHLLSCPQCQAELQQEHELQTLQHGLGSPLGGSPVEAGLARMRARLDAETAAPRTARQRRLPWLMVGLQGLAIAGLLGVLVWPQAGPVPLYRTLSERGGGGSASASADALIMFRPDAREQQIREALQASGATLAGGPTESRAWLLHLPPQDRPQALARLRGQPIVTLVESLRADARPAP